MATLGNPKNTIAVLQKYQFNFQKKFGQNFLIDTGILEEIIEAAQITKDDFVLEIGPGIGTMTQYLCEAARAVVAVEIDTNLIPILKDTLAEYNNVDVLNEDILKVNISKLAEEKQKDTDCCDSTFFNRNSCICRIWCLEKVQRYFDAEPGGTDAPDNQNPE